MLYLSFWKKWGKTFFVSLAYFLDFWYSIRNNRNKKIWAKFSMGPKRLQAQMAKLNYYSSFSAIVSIYKHKPCQFYTDHTRKMQ